MDCDDCRNALSDFLEHALTPVRARQVRGHLDGCEPCQRELEHLETTLRALGSVRAETPPTDLADRAAALVVADGALSRRRPSGAVRATLGIPGAARTSASSRAYRWVGIAAAALLLLGIGFFAGAHRAASGLGDSGGPETATATAGATVTEIARLETELRSVREDLGGRNAALASQLDEMRKSVAAERRRNEREAIAEEGLREEQRAELARARRETLDALARVDLALEQLRDTVAERDQLAADVERLGDELLAARAPEREELEPVELAPKELESSRALTRAELAEPEPPVVVLRRDDALELRLRGTREECLASLFALADDSTDPEVADLALTSLEEQLGTARRSPARLRPETGALAAWFERQVGGDSDERGTDRRTTRRERLRLLRELWKPPREP